MSVRKIRWFRVYDDLVDDPKVQRLPCELFRAMVNLWCLASEAGGVLPDREHIGFKLRLAPAQVDRVLDSLLARNLLDKEGERLSPHNWQERQFKSDQDPTAPTRSKRYRDATRASRVTSRSPETDTDTDTETERKQDAAKAASADLKIVTSTPTPEAQFFRRVKGLCGPNAGGLAKNLLAAKNGSVVKARQVAELASEADDPREYIAAAILKAKNADSDAWQRGPDDDPRQMPRPGKYS